MDDIVLPPMPDAVDLPEVIRNYARAAVIADRERRTAQPEPDIGDYDIDKIADSMPGGIDGFLKHWGWRQFARAIIEADRKRRAEPEPEPAHQVMVYLGVDGLARLIDGGYPTVARSIIRWTNDGRVWIESDDHREYASDVRRVAVWLRSRDETPLAATCARAANLLDGGEL